MTGETATAAAVAAAMQRLVVVILAHEGRDVETAERLLFRQFGGRGKEEAVVAAVVAGAVAVVAGMNHLRRGGRRGGVGG